ncbi:MAG: gamma-glutamyl-gamma-aminobutyrate hydrolase family protein [Colwellia sp.]|nr:gamma-glutamyl-gamma-aminobutyrate hydrolase family protein [Colwellia sp.]MCW8864813.1 gamma-glutamyl-gamma-aminobutyrate hydrolase family protein [Colwellia sp.]MCW9081026.1 gamma-glutamyl-gamma-aminobutyrate hydrolase family protein [Colwellia sp.]
MKQALKPVVGIICDKEILGPHPFHVAGEKYIKAISDFSHCLPVLIPAMADEASLEQLLTMLDGILLTGGYSMVDPLHYQSQAAEAGTKLDTARDNTSLPLIVKAVAQGVPVLGICRGFQEMNVAFGGSLHQKLHEHGQYNEHREDKHLTLAQQYSASHLVNVIADGELAKIVQKTAFEVNSLHTQGVDRLAKPLTIEAVAEDGLVEAFSVTNSESFAMAVQWHPEWQVEKNTQSTQLFHAFGLACAKRKVRSINE